MIRNLSLPCNDQNLLETYKKDTIKRKPFLALFPKNQSRNEEIRIGRISFNESVVTHIQEIGCLLSDISNYNTDE